MKIDREQAFEKQAAMYWKDSGRINRLIFMGVCAGIVLYFAATFGLLYYITTSIYAYLGVTP